MISGLATIATILPGEIEQICVERSLDYGDPETRSSIRAASAYATPRPRKISAVVGAYEKYR